MFFYIFRLRTHGTRRHGNDPALREWVKGSLCFEPVPLDDYGPRMQARLLGPDTSDLILPLQHARVMRVDGVMHIAGIEYYRRGRKGRHQRWKQSWLCAQAPADALPFLDRIQIVSATGFDNEPPDPDIQLDTP